MISMRNTSTFTSSLFKALRAPRVLIAVAMAAVALGTTGCNTIAPPDAPAYGKASSHNTTGQVISYNEMRSIDGKMVLGDRSYAQVNSAWLADFNKRFRRELTRLGISETDRNFDSSRVADLYRVYAQAHYFKTSFHSEVDAEAIAIGSIWYVRETSGTQHALVQAITERGRIFIEPHTGEEIQLSANELRSAYFAAM
ncbi:hypothetical protein [Actomonas aquatica]|uniref:Lipoprotein n=1 Tax=Actomonas aquatica TaxID=2866162 RepID=A0ABZ1CC09_9BACT|nr:hypothetical protein [Opitutus sp. WL0086]WRQ89202.1 hypothetical protein K1X11_007265 [Opitutus sp. WL0086]